MADARLLEMMRSNDYLFDENNALWRDVTDERTDRYIYGADTYNTVHAFVPTHEADAKKRYDELYTPLDQFAEQVRAERKERPVTNEEWEARYREEHGRDWDGNLEHQRPREQRAEHESGPVWAAPRLPSSPSCEAGPTEQVTVAEPTVAATGQRRANAPGRAINESATRRSRSRSGRPAKERGRWRG